MILFYNMVVYSNMGEYGFETVQEALKHQRSAPCFHAKKYKAALLTEPHCVGALNGLQEDCAFVHMSVCVCVCTQKISFQTVILNLALSRKKNCPLQEMHQACVKCK